MVSLDHVWRPLHKVATFFSDEYSRRLVCSRLGICDRFLPFHGEGPLATRNNRAD